MSKEKNVKNRRGPVRELPDIIETLYGSGKGVYGNVREYLRRERRSWNRGSSAKP